MAHQYQLLDQISGPLIISDLIGAQADLVGEMGRAIQFFIIFKHLFMNILHLNTFWHAPCCPTLSPQLPPDPSIEATPFQLESPSVSLPALPDPQPSQPWQLQPQEPQAQGEGKRSFGQVMGRSGKPSIWERLSEANRRPRKRANFPY